MVSLQNMKTRIVEVAYVSIAFPLIACGLGSFFSSYDLEYRIRSKPEFAYVENSAVVNHTAGMVKAGLTDLRYYACPYRAKPHISAVHDSLVSLKQVDEQYITEQTRYTLQQVDSLLASLTDECRGKTAAISNPYPITSMMKVYDDIAALRTAYQERSDFIEHDVHKFRYLGLIAAVIGGSMLGGLAFAKIPINDPQTGGYPDI